MLNTFLEINAQSHVPSCYLKRYIKIYSGQTFILEALLEENLTSMKAPLNWHPLEYCSLHPSPCFHYLTVRVAKDPGRWAQSVVTGAIHRPQTDQHDDRDCQDPVGLLYHRRGKHVRPITWSLVLSQVIDNEMFLVIAGIVEFRGQCGLCERVSST